MIFTGGSTQLWNLAWSFLRGSGWGSVLRICPCWALGFRRSCCTAQCGLGVFGERAVAGRRTRQRKIACCRPGPSSRTLGEDQGSAKADLPDPAVGTSARTGYPSQLLHSHGDQDKGKPQKRRQKFRKLPFLLRARLCSPSLRGYGRLGRATTSVRCRVRPSRQGGEPFYGKFLLASCGPYPPSGLFSSAFFRVRASQQNLGGPALVGLEGILGAESEDLGQLTLRRRSGMSEDRPKLRLREVVARSGLCT